MPAQKSIFLLYYCNTAIVRCSPVAAYILLRLHVPIPPCKMRYSACTTYLPPFRPHNNKKKAAPSEGGFLLSGYNAFIP